MRDWRLTVILSFLLALYPLRAAWAADEGSPASRESAQTGEGDAPALEIWRRDDQGREYRVAFDQGNGRVVRLSAVSFEGGLASRLELAFQHRTPELGEQPKGSYWLTDTRYLMIAYEGGREAPEWHFAGLEGQYVRYMASPFLTLPSDPPKRIWFPFNTGIDVAALEGRVRGPEGARQMDLEALSAFVVLDLLRSPRPGSWLRLGVGGSYQVSFVLPGGWALPTDLRGGVSPFQHGRLAFSLEPRNGLSRLSGRVEVARVYSRAEGWTFQGRGLVELERVVLAFNDRPLSIYLRFMAFEEQTTWQALGESVSWRSEVGLELGRNASH